MDLPLGDFDHNVHLIINDESIILSIILFLKLNEQLKHYMVINREKWIDQL
jgi:hypothetical protein